METTDRLMAAYGRFMTAFEAAATDPEVSRRALDAYNSYTARVPDAWKEPAVTELTQAFEAYRAVIGNGFRGLDAERQIREAFQSYVAEVRETWTEIDPTTLSPADVASIGQSLAYLAWLVETGLGGVGTELNEAGKGAVVDEQGGSLWGSTSLFTDSSRT